MASYSGTVNHELLYARNPISSLAADLESTNYYNITGAKYNWAKKTNAEDYKTISLTYRNLTENKLKEIATDIGNNRDGTFHGEDIVSVTISMFVGGAMLNIKDSKLSNLTTIILNMYNMMSSTDADKKDKSAVFLLDLANDNENYITNRGEFDHNSTRPLGLSLDFVLKGKKKISTLRENLRDDSIIDNNNEVTIEDLLSHELEDMTPPNIGEIYEDILSIRRENTVRDFYSEETLQRDFLQRQQDEHNILDDVQSYQLDGERDSDIGYGLINRNRVLNTRLAKRMRRN